MQQEAVQSLALQAAAWLAGESDMLGHFLGATGMSVEDLRDRLEDPEFQAALLDFVLMDDSWVVNCATHCGIRPEDLLDLRRHLPGGDAPNWT